MLSGKAGITAELLQPDELAAGMLTQMAAEPLLRPVLRAFMATHRGPTIRLCPPARCRDARHASGHFACGTCFGKSLGSFQGNFSSAAWPPMDGIKHC